MKKAVMIFLIAALVAIGSVEPAEKKIGEDCTFEGKKLYGKIQFVCSSPDIKVKSVDAFPDLKVKIVEVFPDKCGQWRIDNSFPDLRVQFVDSFPDLTVKFVETFPGLP